MNLPFTKLAATQKLENALLISILFFIFKIFFPLQDSTVIILINETFAFLAVYFWLLYIVSIIEFKVKSPLAIVLNAGILNALLFFIIAVSSSVLTDDPAFTPGTGFLYVLISSLVSFVFIAGNVYIFAAFRELFFLKQKRDPKSYFNVMSLFIALAFIAQVLEKVNDSLDFLTDTFFVVSIVLITVNSLRVAWIAFLTKRQKLYLLIISVVLSILFGINFYLTFESMLVNQVILNFSYGLQMFFSLIMIYGTIYFGVIFFTTLFHLPTAEAFDRKAEEVSSLMDLSKLITEVFDFKELADTVTTVTNKVCNSESSWLVTKNKDDFELISVNNIGFVEADKLTEAILSPGESDMTKLKITSSREIRLKASDDLKSVNFSSIAAAPLMLHNEINGYLFVGRKSDFEFDEEDQKSISAFADYASVALENAKLIEESLEKERLEKEMDVAREVQYKIIPNNAPKFKDIDISFLFVPAFEVGGDYYDFFELSENKLGFVIADVSGKGISASFVMAEVKGIFASLSKMIDSPKELLVKANDVLKNSLEKKTFVTAIYGVFDFNKGILTFARAGHTPLYHYYEGKLESLTPEGLGLGLDYGDMFSSTLKEMEISFNYNDIIVLFTDGIPESQNINGEEFGYEKLKSIIVELADKPIQQITNEIMKQVSLFAKDNSQHDDITLVIFKKVYNKKDGVI